MSSAIEVAEHLREDRAQATIEAAFAIPLLGVLLLMLLQPGIVLYDKIVMEHAAAEGCRLLATTTAQNASTNEDYIRRRLSAVPEVDLFHVHSTDCTWKIELSGDEASDATWVSISTEIEPLPLIDIALRSIGAVNESGHIELAVESTMETQPSWAQASKSGAPASAIRDAG